VNIFRSLAVGIVLACGLIGCAASVRPPMTTVPSSAPNASTASSSPETDNRADAQAEAHQLVLTATVPPGASPTNVQPVGLSGPAMGSEQNSHLIDSVAYYLVPMTLSQARGWFAAHTPHGFIQSGSASGGTSAGPISYGFEYEVSPSPHWSWGSANLEIGLAPDGPTTTGIRVDGVAQWIDPSPMRDTSPGPATRVTISSGCPKSDRPWNDISNPNAADLHHQLLPTEAPTEALQCTYDGMNGYAFDLVSSQHLDAAHARAAATQILALQVGSVGNTVINCPADDGSASILVFAYPDRADVDIWEHTTGCNFTDNGYIIGVGAL
jgi:hypothetical protein